LVFADPFQVAQELVPELRKQAEVVVLLSQMTTPDTNRLIQEVPGIDAALYGNLAPWVERCSEVGTTVVNQTGTRGQYLGHLVLIVDPDGKVIDWGSKNVQMAENIPEDEEVAAVVAAHEDEVKKALGDSRGGGDDSHGDEDDHSGHNHPGD
jgi:5'-nucleotidase